MFPKKFGTAGNFVIFLTGVIRPLTKFPRDDSLLMVPKSARGKVLQFAKFLGAPASSDIGTDVLQIGPENLGYPIN